jgi:hypothetical protein
VAQLYPRALGSLFVDSYDSQGLRWRYSNLPPHGLCAISRLHMTVLGVMIHFVKKRKATKLFATFFMQVSCLAYSLTQETETCASNTSVAFQQTTRCSAVDTQPPVQLIPQALSVGIKRPEREAHIQLLN